MSIRFRISLFCSFIGVAFIAGCKSNSTGPNNPTVTVTRPGVGSTFIIHSQEFDTLGNPIASKDELDTDFVIASGISYQGKSNVDEFRRGSEPNADYVFYINYESNGDLSIYVDNGSTPGERSGWETIPVASKGTASFIQYDTSGIDHNGQAWRDFRTDSYTFTGEQNLNEAGTTFDALVFDWKSVYSPAGGEVNDEGTYYVGPSIGFILKFVDNVATPYRIQDDLVSYTLK